MKKAKKVTRSQKSLYLPDWIWEKLADRAQPAKQSFSGAVEVILEKELANDENHR